MGTRLLQPALLLTLAPLARGQVAWTRPELLEARFGHALLYDSVRGRALLFGGAGGELYQDTWEWDGMIWAVRHPANRPSARANHALAFDAARGVGVLFGGESGQLLGDTLEWNGSTWLDRTPIHGPAARRDHAMTYDPVRRRVILFGGDTQSVWSNETWEWDGSVWTQRSPVHAPVGGPGPALTFDPARGVAVLFGGFSSDTWEWDGTDWQRRSTIGPSPRLRCTLSYDPVRRRTVLFGGRSPDYYSFYNDTWEWDGSGWSQRTPVHAPAPRNSSAVAFDPSRARLVLFGGYDISAFSDTWEWDGNDWQERAPEAVPSLSARTLVYDSARGRCVLFGSGSHGYSGPQSETWEWDGVGWVRRTPDHNPPPRGGHAMAYDSRRGRAVVFGGDYGGDLDDTWEWDGTDWAEIQPAVRPPARSGHAMAYDSIRGQTVLFGGFARFSGPPGNDTWEWDGRSWRQLAPPLAPSPRRHHVLAEDGRGHCVLFGGEYMTVSDTWQWDGSAWAQRSPTSSPSARAYAAVAYDAARARVVLFGGSTSPTGGGYQNDTWEWDGAEWTQRVSSLLPAQSARHALAFDLARGRIVLYGGPELSHTWEYGPIAPGEFTAFGTGCAGSAGTPLLDRAPGQVPYLGRPFRIELLQLPPVSPALLWLGASNTAFGPLPLPLDLTPIGMTGCVLRVSLDIGTLLMPVNGVAALDLLVPADPSLTGVSVFTQGFAFDPFANPFGASTSNAGALRIGSP